jgi:hypothetical protein
LRCRTRAAWVVALAVGISACANDFDQFDFGRAGETSRDGSPVEVPTAPADAAGDATEGGNEVAADVRSEMGLVADARTPWDSPADVADAGWDVATDVLADARPTVDSSTADGWSRRDASRDSSVVDDASGNADASIVDEVASDADASLEDVSIGADVGPVLDGFVADADEG